MRSFSGSNRRPVFAAADSARAPSPCQRSVDAVSRDGAGVVVRRSSGSLWRQSAPKAPPWRSPGFARSRVAEATRAGELRRGEARVRVARGTRVGTRVGTRARFARLARVAGGARGKETDSRSGGALRGKRTCASVVGCPPDTGCRWASPPRTTRRVGR